MYSYSPWSFKKIGLLIGLINNTAKCSPICWGISVIPRFSDQKLSSQEYRTLQLPHVLILSCSWPSRCRTWLQCLLYHVLASFSAHTHWWAHDMPHFWDSSWTNSQVFLSSNYQRQLTVWIIYLACVVLVVFLHCFWKHLHLLIHLVCVTGNWGSGCLWWQDSPSGKQVPFCVPIQGMLFSGYILRPWELDSLDFLVKVSGFLSYQREVGSARESYPLWIVYWEKTVLPWLIGFFLGTKPGKPRENRKHTVTSLGWQRDPLSLPSVLVKQDCHPERWKTHNRFPFLSLMILGDAIPPFLGVANPWLLTQVRQQSQPSWPSLLLEMKMILSQWGLITRNIMII